VVCWFGGGGLGWGFLWCSCNEKGTALGRQRHGGKISAKMGESGVGGLRVEGGSSTHSVWAGKNGGLPEKKKEDYNGGNFPGEKTSYGTLSKLVGDYIPNGTERGIW